MKNNKTFILTAEQVANVFGILQDYLEKNAKKKIDAEFQFDVFIYTLKESKKCQE